VREVPVGVIIVPAFGAVAQARVRDAAFFVSFSHRFHFTTPLVCVQHSVFVLPFRDATCGVVPAFGAVAQARVRHVPVGGVPAFDAIAPALVRDVPVVIVPELGAIAPAIVRDVPFFVSFSHPFHFTTPAC